MLFSRLPPDKPPVISERRPLGWPWFCVFKSFGVKSLEMNVDTHSTSSNGGGEGWVLCRSDVHAWNDMIW